MKDKIISIIKKNGIKEWMLRITEKRGLRSSISEKKGR